MSRQFARAVPSVDDPLGLYKADALELAPFVGERNESVDELTSLFYRSSALALSRERALRLNEQVCDALSSSHGPGRWSWRSPVTLTTSRCVSWKVADLFLGRFRAF